MSFTLQDNNIMYVYNQIHQHIYAHAILAIQIYSLPNSTQINNKMFPERQQTNNISNHNGKNISYYNLPGQTNKQHIPSLLLVYCHNNIYADSMTSLTLHV